MFNKTKIILVYALFTSILLGQNVKELDLKLTYKSLPFGLTSLKSEYDPHVSLALSGGGARGISQLGVLKALNEYGIEIDEIIGTSMGSIVGGLYSAGYSLDALDSLIIHAPWRDFFSIEETSRRELFLEQKITSDKAILALRLDGFEPVIPTAINTGQRVSNFLNLLSLNAPLNTISNFNELLVSFKAISTNLVTGEPYILDEGTLGIAMRASSSVSLVLEPVNLDSVILVDGGLVANVPVKIANEQGADYIIAVDATSPLRSAEDLKYPWEVADQLVSIPMRMINAEHLQKADVIIYPAIKEHKNNDFTNLIPLLDFGYQSTIESIDKIKNGLKELWLKRIDRNDIAYNNISIKCDDSELSNFIKERLNKIDEITEGELIYLIAQYPNLDDYKDISVNVLTDSLSNVFIISTQNNPVIENIIIKGANLIDADSIITHSISLRNRSFNTKKVLEVFLNILREYRKQGFSLVGISDYVFENGTLEIYIDEQIIDEINVLGNEKTAKEIIIRELPFKSGSIFKSKEIEEGLSNLRSTNLFERVEFKLEKINGKNLLNIEVIEKPSLMLRFGLRIDNEYFSQISFDLRDENMMGIGTEVGLIFSGGIRNQSLAIEHRANRVFNTYLTYRIKGFYESRDINTYQDDSTGSDKRFKRSKLGEYSQSYLGGSIGVGAQLEKLGNLIFEGKYQRDRIISKEEFPSHDTYSVNITAVKILLSIDTRDKYPFPNRGIMFNGFYETAQSAFGGDIGYTKLYFDYNSVFQLSDNHVLNYNIKFGYGDETLPLSQQFSFGGQNNFFGYREHEFRGRQIFVSSLEYQTKLPINLFFDTYVKARYDLGSVWAQQENIRFKDLRHGIGASLAFDTPIGPAEFSVGKSFLLKKSLPDNIISWGDTHIYFTIGYYY